MDVNQTPFNRAINYPPSQWTAATLDCLKTEGFGFTLQRNLDKSEAGCCAERVSGISSDAAKSSGGNWRRDHRVDERGSFGAGKGLRERGAVRAGPDVSDRLWAAAAGDVPAKREDGELNWSRLLHVQNVSKVYRLYRRPLDRLTEILPFLPHQPPSEFWALRDVNLSVERGEVLGVVGPNGSGKSTLLQIICGILEPTRGRVLASGRIAALLELGRGFQSGI